MQLAHYHACQKVRGSAFEHHAIAVDKARQKQSAESELGEQVNKDEDYAGVKADEEI